MRNNPFSNMIKVYRKAYSKSKPSVSKKLAFANKKEYYEVILFGLVQAKEWAKKNKKYEHYNRFHSLYKKYYALL